MPIGHFDIFTAERQLIQTSAVSQLADTRLGIEGNDWLRKIVLKEPAVTAMGGLPLRLKESIEKELKQFKANGITPSLCFQDYLFFVKINHFQKKMRVQVKERLVGNFMKREK
ncbi:unnamed protein product [Rhizopus stolonifer]